MVARQAPERHRAKEDPEPDRTQGLGSPRESATYTADQFSPAPSPSAKQKARIPSKTRGALQPPNHRLKPSTIPLPVPPSDGFTSASTREGSNSGAAARPATAATTPQVRNCADGA